MLITDKDNKALFVMIELSQILKHYNCTYNEAEQIISDLQFEIKRQREEKEYDDLNDYFNQIKTYDCGNEIVKGWEHYEVEV